MKSHPCPIVGSKEREESLFFMLNALLQSRIDTGEETSDDEDVNVYLAGLLHSLADQTFYREARDLVSSYDSEVHGKAEACEDLRGRYRVYKSNGDYALVSTGIFDHPVCDRRLGGRGPKANEGAGIERGRIYYQVAADLSARLRHGRSGVSDVLWKLSGRFETYVRILSHMRAGSLKLIARLSDGEVYHLQRQAQEGARPALSHSGRDRFLDAYSDWKKTGSEADRERVNAIGRELSAVDPAFVFEGV